LKCSWKKDQKVDEIEKEQQGKRGAEGKERELNEKMGPMDKSTSVAIPRIVKLEKMRDFDRRH